MFAAPAFCNSDGFIKQPTGTCPAGTYFIETDAGCAAAATSVGLSSTTVYDWVTATGSSSGDRTNPHGCYFKKSNGLLFQNPGGDRNDDDTDRVSLCSCTPGKSNQLLPLRSFQPHIAYAALLTGDTAPAQATPRRLRMPFPHANCKIACGGAVGVGAAAANDPLLAGLAGVVGGGSG